MLVEYNAARASSVAATVSRSRKQQVGGTSWKNAASVSGWSNGRRRRRLVIDISSCYFSDCETMWYRRFDLNWVWHIGTYALKSTASKTSEKRLVKCVRATSTRRQGRVRPAHCLEEFHLSTNRQASIRRSKKYTKASHILQHSSSSSWRFPLHAAHAASLVAFVNTEIDHRSRAKCVDQMTPATQYASHAALRNASCRY